MYSWTELSLIAEELFVPLALDQVFSLKRCLKYGTWPGYMDMYKGCAIMAAPFEEVCYER